MAAIYGRKFVFGIPNKDDLSKIQNWFAGDQVIAEAEDFLKIKRDGRLYAVEKIENGYSAFPLNNE